MIKKNKRKLNIFILVLGIAGILDFCFLSAYGVAVGNFGIMFPLVVGILLSLVAIFRLTGRGNLFKIKNTFLKSAFIFICAVFILSFVLIEGLIILSSASDNNVEVDYLIILGTGLRGDEIPQTFKNRLDQGLKYLNDNPDIMVVVSGGQGPGESISEAEAMRRYLTDNGVDEDRIILEDKSTSTAENMKYTANILENLTGRQDYRVMIATNEFHLFRSKILAKHNGFTPYGISASTTPYIMPNSFIREYFAVVKSLVFDIMLDKS
ncbi:MAG: DUF218 domain-containing protein [Clostridium sp.]|nr:DUF218 domain-containing protein [Clostridium sp.]